MLAGPLLALSLALLPTPAAAQHFDVLIRGGQVLDGSGSPAFTADVGINDDRIVAIGKLPDATATRVIDAAGKYVVPGFIDMHSHADRVFASDDVEGRRAHNLVMQGITTSVFGPDGRNPVWPVADEMDAYRAPGVATNVVPMVGHATVRGMVMGDDYERPATEAEIAEMAEMVRAGMEDGAWGLGAGPEYRPGRFSTTGELIALAREVAPYDGFYYSHQRSQSPLPLWQIPSIVDGQPLTGTDGMRETIEIGRATGIRVVGTHIKAKGTDTWGHSATDVLLIEAARREGVQVYLDQYPYETFGGGPVDVIPDWGYAPPGTDRSGGLDAPLWRDADLMSDPKGNLRANLADPVTGRGSLSGTPATSCGFRAARTATSSSKRPTTRGPWAATWPRSRPTPAAHPSSNSSTSPSRPPGFRRPACGSGPSPATASMSRTTCGRSTRPPRPTASSRSRPGPASTPAHTAPSRARSRTT